MRRTAASIGFILLAAMAGCKSTTTASGPAPAGTTAAGTPPATATATAGAPPTAAASTGATNGAATTKVDPCSLLTAADLTGALGASPGGGTSTPAGVYQSCIYGSAKVVVLVRSIDKSVFDKSAAANPGSVKPVSGIGQDAYTADGDILAWQNGTELVIRVEGGSLAVVEKLATAAVGRL